MNFSWPYHPAASYVGAADAAEAVNPCRRPEAPRAFPRDAVATTAGTRWHR